MDDNQKKVEAVLFSIGKKIKLEELSRLTSITNIDDLKSILFQLQEEYDKNDSSLMLIEEGDSWKLTVREKFMPIVQNIVTETELTKSVMETLAVIAWKYPILQSDVIKIRTNKAYDHLKQLQEDGFISRTKYGRTNKIKLTDKFFTYFDLPHDREKTQSKFEKLLPERVKKKLEKLKRDIKKQEQTLEDKKVKKEKLKEFRQKEKEQQDKIDKGDIGLDEEEKGKEKTTETNEQEQETGEQQPKEQETSEKQEETTEENKEQEKEKKEETNEQKEEEETKQEEKESIETEVKEETQESNEQEKTNKEEQ